MIAEEWLGSIHAQLERVSGELELCRRELAQARRDYEEVSERLYRQRRKSKTLRRRLDQLARSVARHLNQSSPPTGLKGVAAYVMRHGLRRPATAQELASAARLRKSKLFNEQWYVAEHPTVVESGLPPALHYLKIGAREGFDPGPKFDTRRYLATHPEVALSGENPLLHHLRHRKNQRRQPG